MRLKINFSKNLTSVRINNQSDVNYFIYTKCLGKNNKYHNAKNDYSISNLYGGKLNLDKKTLSFNNGGFIIISSKNEEFLNDIIKGLYNNDVLFNGMKFINIEFISENFYDGWNYFSTLSPFIIKKYISKDKYDFYTFNDDNFNEIITERTKNKLLKINNKLNLSEFKIEILKHNKHKIKKILIKNVKNYANQCQINIFCKKEVAELIYNLGIGQSTGCGFGTIYKTENHNKYKI